MANLFRYLSLALLCITTGSVAVGTRAMAGQGQEGIMVGRITHIEGKLLRYIEENKDWVVTVQDSPFGLEDALYTEEDARAEFIMPNRTWLRMGENTQIQLIDLNPEATTLDVGSGLVRLYNRSAKTVVKATTPYGYVVASGEAVFDLYVGDESLEVTAIRGKVDFVHEHSEARVEVGSGSSIIASTSETARGNGTVDSSWDDWNGERDAVWHKRSRGRSASAAYLPEPLRDEAWELDETGRWERVYYEGRYRNMWRPLRVERGWRPFTAGRWVVYYGDNCWIPDEPFGYVTHHYGSWIYVEARRCWYWVPPVRRVVAGTPRFSLGFGWYPGRVGWMHSGTYIGWVPLAPYETYYCYRPWGYRTVVVDPAVEAGISFNLGSFLFINHAVVIHRDYLFRGTRYTPYLERNIDKNVIIGNYRPVTVINNTVINNYSNDVRRFAYSDAEALRKPHGSVIDRIAANHSMHGEFGRIGRERIMGDMTRVHTLAEPSAMKESTHLRVANRLVNPVDMHKPLAGLAPSGKELKGRERLVADSRLMRRSLEGGRAGKAHDRPEGGSRHGGGKELRERHGRGGEKFAFAGPVEFRGKMHRQGLPPEQLFSPGGYGHHQPERLAMASGGKGHSGHHEESPHGSRHQPHGQQEEAGSGHKGGGNHRVWQEEQSGVQEQHGRGRGGRKSD